MRIERARKRWVTLKLRHHTILMLNESAKMVGMALR